MKKHKRKHTPEFKDRIAFEAIQGIKTQNEIAKEYKIHPITVSKWKNELLSRMPEIFATENPKKDKNTDREKESLQRKVGQLTMKVDFLEKKVRSVGNTRKRAALITPDSQLSIRHQCRLLHLPRSIVSYKPKKESADNQLLKELIDRFHQKWPQDLGPVLKFCFQQFLNHATLRNYEKEQSQSPI